MTTSVQILPPLSKETGYKLKHQTPGFPLSDLCKLISSVFLETEVNFHWRGCLIALIVQRKETCTHLIQKSEKINLLSQGRKPQRAKSEREFLKKERPNPYL